MKNIICMMTFLMFLSITFASGGFGEVAGPLVYNAFVSGPQTRTWTLVNTYNFSLGFYITKPNMTNVSITTSVTNGTIKANSYFPVSVTIVSHTNKTESGSITAYAVSNGTSNLKIGISKSIEINGTGTVSGQMPSQAGNSSQTTKSTTSSIQTTAGSTSIQTTQIATQNKNSSIQSAGGGAAALSVSVIIPYLIVAIVLLSVVVCALVYHITKKKPVTKKPRKKKKPLRRRR